MNNIQIPPKLAERLLSRFLREDLAEEVLGDLEEKFYADLTQRSLLRARLNYWYQVINYLRPFAIRKSRIRNTTLTIMLRHNLLVSFRNFKRFKSTFLINLIGLSTGLACVILIYLWINDELQVDAFHRYDSRLFQIMENNAIATGITTLPSTPDILAENMVREFPEIQWACGVTPYEWFGNFTIVNEDNHQKAIGQYAGEDYFKMFSYPLFLGDANHALDGKNTIVISRNLAERLFKSPENAIGKTLEVQIIGQSDLVNVTGIFENQPANSTRQFDFVLSWKLWRDISNRVGRQVNWDNHGPETYVVLKEGADAREFNHKIENYIKTKNENSNTSLFATSYSGRYLYGTYENGVQAGGRIMYIELFSAIALFILIIACINFMNLSTARASRRLKEVGIKKALGVDRKALVIQHLTESLLLTFISLVVAVFLVILFLPQFNEITGKVLSLHLGLNFLLAILVISILTGLVSGSYPALYLSRFAPAFILKGGQLRASIGELWARKGLIVFQFALSVILILSVVIVYQQVRYVQTKNLGYTKDNVIHFDIEGKVVENKQAFLAEVRNLPGVVNASSVQSIMVGHKNGTSGVSWPGKDPDEIISFEVVTVDYQLLETLGIDILKGRFFSSEYSTDSETLIFNETAISAMGLEDPVGQTVKFWGVDQQVLGVAKDFHFESLHEQIKPLIFRLAPDETLKVLVKVEGGKETETLARLEELYDQFNPGYSFDVRFLDQDYQSQYVSEQRVSALSKYFAGFAILISCLGLFGLAAFTAERRQKEIGIRKVLGSSVWSLMYLLSAEFTLLVLAGIAIALPVGYLISRSWLQDFAYAIDLNAWYFVVTALVALLLAWLTVGFQTFKSAQMNPVKSLRSE